ncbi:uncharacterized protein LOC121308872 isoform X2 [Polyodon spathula]|uniref:uncharacterized protein LOC121308872 isoform X2 n=1 Tax=Polyodon spathula TaxID=7913 RepID=UPI001B7F6E0D|nr:uncharacterized protein LOC121308872 isoform X2 [Polyodon spathula]
MIAVVTRQGRVTCEEAKRSLNGAMLRWLLLLLAVQSLFTRAPAAEQVEPEVLYFNGHTSEVVLNATGHPAAAAVSWDWGSHDGRVRNATLLAAEFSGGAVRYFNDSGFNAALEFGDCCALKIKRPGFDSAGSFTLRQTAPASRILARYELVGMKVSTSSENYRRTFEDVTLRCSASKLLPNTLSLAWKRDGVYLEQKSSILRFDNALYFIKRHDCKPTSALYLCEMQCSGTVLQRGNIHGLRSKFYRASLPESQFVIPIVSHGHRHFFSSLYTIYWEPQSSPYDPSAIAHVDTVEYDFNTTSEHFENRTSFSLDRYGYETSCIQIQPVLFEDAGEYTARGDHANYYRADEINYRLITIQVSVTVEGSGVSLHCTASSLPALTRLLWIDWEGREAASGQGGGSRTLTLEVPADAPRGEWTCALLEGGFPKAVYPYQLDTSTFVELLDGCFTDSVLFWVLVGYLTVKTAACVGLCFCFKKLLDIKVEKEMRTKRLRAGTARDNNSTTFSMQVSGE